MNLQNAQCSTNPYFENKRIRQCLINAGLINRRGDILPPKIYEVVLGQRTKHKYGKVKVSPIINKYVVENEQNHRIVARHVSDCEVKRFQEAKHRSIANKIVDLDQPPTTTHARSAHSINPKQALVRTQSFYGSPVNAKNELLHRPMTAKQSTKDSYCEVTMIYYGPQLGVDLHNNWLHPNGDEVVAIQQLCDGKNFMVFKGFVKPNETFTFESRRYPDYPFVISLYVNSYMDSRISVCCEYKHKRHVRLGSNRGLFGFYDVQKSKPCRNCEHENQQKKILPASSTIVNPSRSSSASSTLLRRQSPSPGRRKESTKSDMNVMSTAVQISRTQSADSSQDRCKTDEYKTHSSMVTFDDKSIVYVRQLANTRQNSNETLSKVSYNTSRKSRPRSPTVPFQIEDLQLSSESSFVRTSNDNNKSPYVSRKPRSSPLRSFQDEHDCHLPTQSANINHRPTISSSSISSEASNFISVSKQQRYSSSSSSNTSSSTTIPIFHDNIDQSSSSTTRGQKHSSSDSTVEKTTELHSPRIRSTKRINRKKQTSRSSSSVSTASDSTLKNEEDDRLSTSFSSTEMSQSSYQCTVNEPESGLLAISSTNIQRDDINNTSTSDNHIGSKSKLISKRRR